jgi:ATP/maltotriose-dependent transcriptional regulator MalT
VIPPPEYRRLRHAYARGEADIVLTGAQAVLDELAADPEGQDLIAPVLAMVGACLAGQERLNDALAYLERARTMPRTDAAEHEMGRDDTFTLIELDTLLLVGRYRDAWPLVQRLGEPGRALESRLGAARAHVAIAAVFGDYDTANNLLNTATGLAHQLGSRIQSVVVDGDRAVVLATQGRTLEAVRMADEVLPLLARPGPGPRLAWAISQGITVATAVARAVALAGDSATAERVMASISAVTELPGRDFDRGQIALARGTVRRVGGHLGEAEGPITEARRVFLELGCAPAAALAQLEEAHLARARGYEASARPLFDRARAEYGALGLRREVVAIDALLATPTA